jgi:nicotinate-nucleotide adenylyltransferase
VSGRRLGLLGGSFDPIHRGHLHAARTAQAAFDLDRVIFVPAAHPPHKPDRRLAPGPDRLALVELAIAGEPTWSACDLELHRSGPSYTIDTVRELAEYVGEPARASLFLILGLDNLEGLLDWQRADELLERVQPVLIPRAGAPLPDLDRLLEGRPVAWRAALERGLLELPNVSGRSTDLRATFAGDAPASQDLPPGVEQYIRSHGLYQDR